MTRTYEVGALLRRPLRAFLDESSRVCSVDWREHKGWLMSSFVVTAPRDVHWSIQQWASALERAAEHGQ